MNRFRYEATDRTGTPVYGVLQCDHENDLKRLLEGRGQTLVSARELSLDEFSRQQANLLPRLVQLRVGERLHDAMLTQLPAHDAIRAVASEPMQVPLLAILPWLYVAGFCLFSSAFVVTWLDGRVAGWTVLAGMAGLVLLAWRIHRVVVSWSFGRPRRALLKIADQLEKGTELNQLSHRFLPAEMHNVLEANLTDDLKARATSELMPGLLKRSNHLQRLAFAIALPLTIVLVLNLILCLGGITVLPLFQDTYEGFGVTLPSLTAFTIWVGSLLADFGWSGLTTMTIVGFSLILGVVVIVCSGWGHDHLARIPWFGAIFRWSMQARICRTIAALCRNGADNASVISTATAGSGFRSVKLQGEHLVEEINQGSCDWRPGGALTGLPIALLKGVDGADSSDERRAGVAATFQNLGNMLEEAAIAKAKVLAALIQGLVFGYTILVVVFVELSLLLPMFKLINDLS